MAPELFILLGIYYGFMGAIIAICLARIDANQPGEELPVLLYFMAFALWPLAGTGMAVAYAFKWTDLK